MDGDSPRNNLADDNGAHFSKVRLNKTPSQIAPSEASHRSKSGGDHARKNPLDALSRSSLRSNVMERRSGLQDVDENFLARNIFAYPPRAHPKPGFNPIESVPMPDTPAQQPKEIPVAGLPSYQRTPVAGQQVQHRFYNQPQQQVVPPQQQQLQQQQQQPIAVVASHQQAAPQQMQQQQQHVQQVQQQQQQQQRQPADVAQQQHQQQSPPPPVQKPSQTRMPAGYMEQSQAEPDMCTTCPNCQTTIFLMRSGATPMDTNMMVNQEPGPN